MVPFRFLVRLVMYLIILLLELALSTVIVKMQYIPPFKQICFNDFPELLTLMTLNLTKIQNFFMQLPIIINKVGRETHIINVLNRSPCVRCKAKPSLG